MNRDNCITVPSVFAHPWEPSSVSAAVSGGIRPVLVVSAGVRRVFADGFPDELPCIAEWSDSNGNRLKSFEIPASGLPASPDQDASCNELLVLRCLPNLSQQRELTIELVDQLPRIPTGPEFVVGRTDDDPPSDSHSWRTASIAAESVIDCHVDLVHGLFEVPSDGWKPDRWQGKLGAHVLRSVWDLAEAWCQAGRPDQPRMSLIVRLARMLPGVLKSVCESPRSVLRRERQLTGLDRVREIDSSCLRWLARQPGETVVEKAGTRQRVLSVVRVQSVDTLENRVVRDLLIRAQQACQRYLREYGSSARRHNRVESVSSFRRLISRLLRESPLAGAEPLSGIPQANYVLQMDPRYRQLWKAYQQLVRQQQLEDTLWRWRHRVLAEHVQFGVIASLNELCDRGSTYGGDVVLQTEQNAGTFLDPRTALGPWRLQSPSGVLVDLIRQDQLALHPLVPSRTGELSPDFTLVMRSGGRHRVVGIWCLSEFSLGREKIESRVNALARVLEESRIAIDYGLLVEMSAPGDARQSLSLESGRIRALQFSPPLTEHLPQLIESLRWALER